MISNSLHYLFQITLVIQSLTASMPVLRGNFSEKQKSRAKLQDVSTNAPVKRLNFETPAERFNTYCIDQLNPQSRNDL